MQVENSYIKIDWNILTICNFKCSYCYARKSEQWNKILSNKQIDHIIKIFKNSNHNFQISLMGGEPSLFPKISSLVEKLNIPNIKKNSNLYKWYKIY